MFHLRAPFLHGLEIYRVYVSVKGSCNKPWNISCMIDSKLTAFGLVFRFEFFHSGRLDLDETGLTGTVPTELGLVSNLGEYFITFVVAKVSDNFFYTLSTHGLMLLKGALWLNGNNITGTIPTELALLGNLTFLELSHNQLSGNLPSDLLGMHSLSKF